MRYKKIITTKQLKNIDEGRLTSLLVTHGGTETRTCHAFKNPKNGQITLFNNFANSRDYGVSSAFSALNGVLSNDDMTFISRHYQGAVLVQNDETFWHNYNFTSLELYDEDIVKAWYEFASSNKKFISTLKNAYGNGIESNNSVIVIYAWANGSKNYVEWAIKAHFRNRIRMFRIKYILEWCANYENLVKQLHKSTITAYKNSSDIDDLFNEIKLLRQAKRANDSIAEFNTTQKKLFREQDLSKNKELEESLSQFARLSDVKRRNFIRKVSTIDSFDELFKNLKWAVSKHFEWNKDSFMEYLNNVEELEYEIKTAENNIVLLSVKDFDTIQKLAKTTNWCISKNKSYWKQYTQGKNNLIQYLLFNFNCKEDDLLSIVGFTVQTNKGIIYAHDFSNNNIMSDNKEIHHVPLHSLIPCVAQNSGIYSVLDSCGIDPSSLVRFTSVPYKWTKEEMFNYLFKIVSKKDVEILHDLGDKVVFVIETSCELGNFFGRAYNDNLGTLESYVKHFVFADFTKNQYDSDRMRVALISQGSYNEEYCYAMYNLNFNENLNQFNTLLSDYGLPYDIIRRPANTEIMLWEALDSYNIELAEKMVEDGARIPNIVRNYCEDMYLFMEKVSQSIITYNSLDYLNFFYKKNLTLLHVMGEECTKNLLISIYQDIHAKLRHAPQMFNSLTMGITEGEKKSILSGNVSEIPMDRAIIVKDFIALEMIVSKEAVHEPYMISSLCNNILQECGNERPLIAQLLAMVIPYANTDWQYSVLNSLLRHVAFNYKDNELVQNALIKVLNKYSQLDSVYKSHLMAVNGKSTSKVEWHFSDMSDLIDMPRVAYARAPRGVEMDFNDEGDDQGENPFAPQWEV